MNLQGIIAKITKRKQPHGQGFTTQRVPILAALSLVLLFAIQGTGLRAEEQVVQIRIVHRDAGEMLAIVQPMVSPHGYISADGPSNSLIVIDDPAAIARIEDLVAKIDRPVPQLKIRVQYGYRKNQEEQSATVEGRVEAGDVTVGTGERRQEGVDVGLTSQNSRQQDRGEYTILVSSGTTAFISSGYDVPYPARWSRLSHRYGHTHSTVTFKKVDTGFDVRPVLVGEIVQIEITPRISYLGRRGLRQPIRFAEAATRVNAPLGQWIEIAGVDTQYADLHRQILSGGRASGEEQLGMRLMVTLN